MSPSSIPIGVAESTILEPIAICGMACRLPGGIDSDSSFWKMLVEKRTGQTPKVPKSRFNIDAHYHENLDRPGSFNVAGGYFLDRNPVDFDPTFFNMTPIEAQWLDPQQRKILEVSYECLVSAGLTLDQVSGSNTAVFVGCFTADYQQMSTRDPDFRHNYIATGVDPGIMSNRIGNTFNLNGPSFTINTACSSSVYAIHNACHALRARDCDAAIAGGVNLIITVDQHMNTAKLGILSPTSTCHTFDASADGYGRGEGAGALYLKRLTDAIRDCDPIRGVIRSTAVNTNGKVDGMGITHPSVKGQERVVRLAYEKAKLDPNLTAYAELHGTGTPVGDPIEVRAISRALNDTRSNNRPLRIGALKPNVGHSEAASGIFAVMKAALMTEAAVIPGVALFNKLNPEILEDEWNVRVQANTAPWPKDHAVRRASVSSFGYGGTNGHVIVEAVDSLHPWYQHGKPKKEAKYDHSSTKPHLVCFSAHDKATLSRNIDAHANVAADYYVADLAHTLNLHRTKFSHRAFAIMREGQEAESLSAAALRSGVAPKKKGDIGFIFTGQGAQWAGMGRVAMSEFSIFRDTIEKLDIILYRLSPTPTFKIADLLLGDPEITATIIGDAEVSQPLSTAVQIALVDLFSQWNISPFVSIGHSSGEIGAAYAAGLISAPEAMIAAFCRGRAVKARAVSGSMLAVGLGAEEVKDYLPLDSTQICIACENSQSSVTLSGEADAISHLREHLSSKDIFARELKTGRAYHSPHMRPVSETYDLMLAQALTVLSEDDLLWRRERSHMISSVTGDLVEGEALPSEYWSANLVQRVLFNTAVKRMGSDELFSDVRNIIEIGPHSALSGPFKQIMTANKFDRFVYIPSMTRNKNDADQILSVAGSLFLASYDVDLEEVNGVNETSMIRKPKTQYLLVDLPPYQWNYEKEYWWEPRGSAEQRARVYPRHDILGSRVSGLSDSRKVWRNILRHRDVPWLKDHSLGGTAIFPAAGHLSLAIEALRQVHETEGLAFEGVTIRDVNIKTALVIPDTADGIETVVVLEVIDGSNWHSFSVESFADNEWSVHCEGKISATHNPVISGEHPVKESALTQRVSGKRWYDAFHRVGFKYTKTFQKLQDARTDRNLNHAAGGVQVVDNSGVIDGESRYIIHPSTVDACLQLIIISIHAGKHKEMPWGVVPTNLEEVTMFFPGEDSAQLGRAVAWTDGFDGRRFNTHTRLYGQSGKLLMNISGLTCISYEAALPADAQSSSQLETFSTAVWKPDVTTLSSAKIQPQTLDEALGFIQHQSPIEAALIAGSPSSDIIESVLKVLPLSTAVTIGFAGEQEVDLSDSTLARTTVKTLPVSEDEWEAELKANNYGLVLVDYSGFPSTSSKKSITELMGLVNGKGWLIGSSKDFSSTPSSALQLGQYFASSKAEKSTLDSINSQCSKITALSMSSKSPYIQSIVDAASGFEKDFSWKHMTEFNPETDQYVVIDDTAGDMLLSIQGGELEALKVVLSSGVPTLWLTSGVKQGKCPGGNMAEGFLRVIRSEQASAKIVLMDFDQGENSQDVARALITTLYSANTKDSGEDTEFWLHRGTLHIPRIYPNTTLNQEWDETSQALNVQEKVLTKGSTLKAKTVDGSVAFERDSRQPVLADNEVEIQVEASELRLTTGASTLVSGQVTQAGSSVDQAVVGQQVIAFAYDELQTIVRSSAFVVVDGVDATSQTTLVGTLAAIQPLALADLLGCKIERGSYVIALPGPLHFTVMSLLLTVSAGASGAVVVNSSEERQFYISQFGLGPEYVILADDLDTLFTTMSKEATSSNISIIAHDFSTLSQEVWRNIPALGKFLLISQGSLQQTPDATPFTRGAMFVPINSKVAHASTKSATALLGRSLDFVKMYPGLLNNSVSFVKPVDVGAVTANELGNETQTVVVSYNYNESKLKVIPNVPHLSLLPDATYLLVGCLGGLGRSLTRWMMERGARHFAFISRSGADKPEAAQVIEGIEKEGAVAKVFRADASDEDTMKQIVLSLNAERPVHGVVHAAMVLKDGMFEQMTHSSFVAAVAPKAQGALSLHRALEGANVDVDFFVMTSSISAVYGNTGQSNYSAANSFLDALALHRNTLGRAATSLALPMVLDVGVVAESGDTLEASLVRKGLYGIDEHEMLRGFEVAMSRPRPLANDTAEAPVVEFADSQLIMGTEVRELARSIAMVGKDNADLYWYNDARFSHVRAALEALSSGNGSGSDGGDESFGAVVKAALAESPDAALQAIAVHIAKRMSGILGLEMESFELDGPSLASYGLDSMIGAEMRTWLFKEFGLDYPFQKLLAPTLSFKVLAKVVAEKMGIVPVEG
ncbi:putative polyketide synthase [Jackrogersella minutella]|nr:putative polyketide synthase [Jackrogersella minutella]